MFQHYDAVAIYYRCLINGRKVSFNTARLIAELLYDLGLVSC